MEESLLIIACQQQQPFGQKTLFDTYYQRMYQLARRYLNDHHDTEDVLIIAFNRIFKNIGGFEYRGEGSLQKWITTIVINESLRLISKRKKLYTEEACAADIPENDGEIDTIDEEEVYQILEAMPDGYRTIFNLFAIEGYSHKEIAKMLSISENTSKSQLSKARNYIIQRLRNKNYGIA